MLNSYTIYFQKFPLNGYAFEIIVSEMRDYINFQTEMSVFVTIFQPP